jgi:hydroxymethylpyrimidine kinase / phosphomethylpyrimidine kinase / thiamine-phosphate diphosphorylase
MHPPVALTIAGSDPTTGAGIQADTKTLTYLGVHPATIITAITAQNTQHVTHIYPLPTTQIQTQLQTILTDLPITSVKTGMLHNKHTVHTITTILKTHHLNPIVDPILTATTTDTLSDTTLPDALTKELLPQALLLTPNIPEAQTLLNTTITTLDDAKKAAKHLYDLGPCHILLKGGHLHTTDATDLYYDGTTIHTYTLPRLPTTQTHGTGCTLSALITGLLALDTPLHQAIPTAKRILWAMINERTTPGKGADVPNTTHTIMVPPEFPTPDHAQTWCQLHDNLPAILAALPATLIPEVGINIAHAIPQAITKQDVCALQGRIVRAGNRPLRCGTLTYGASKHVASIVLAAIATDPTMQSAMNLRFSDPTITRAKRQKMTTGTFDRNDEPAGARSTMDWGTRSVIHTLGYVPDLIYDRGGLGKEPMIRLLAHNPAELATKLRRLSP